MNDRLDGNTAHELNAALDAMLGTARDAIRRLRPASRWMGALGLAAILVACLAVSPVARAQEEGFEPAPPQTEMLEALVTEVLDEQMVDMGGRQQLLQTLELEVTTGEEAGRRLVVENGQWAAINVPRYTAGDRVVIERAFDAGGGSVYYVTDYVRRSALLWLFALFVVLTIAVGRARGAASLVGMGLSFLVLFAFVLPQIGAGRDPITVAILAAVVIIPFTFYLSHGLSWKTSAAVLGTLFTLVLTGLLARLAVEGARLTGYASEEAYFLQATAAEGFNVRGLLLASILIGLLGILDDITISQAAVVQQLHHLSPESSLHEIYSRAMDVGRDHIASLVNTLVLVYASSAMPLLLLFSSDQAGFRQAINYEVVAEEVVRTLVASSGLIAAVPITTVLACWLAARGAMDAAGSDPHAHHGH